MTVFAAVPVFVLICHGMAAGGTLQDRTPKVYPPTALRHIALYFRWYSLYRSMWREQSLLIFLFGYLNSNSFPHWMQTAFMFYGASGAFALRTILSHYSFLQSVSVVVQTFDAEILFVVVAEAVALVWCLRHTRSDLRFAQVRQWSNSPRVLD